MIPLRDYNPSGTVPVMTFLLIVINVMVFVWEVRQPPARLERYIEYQGGLVPRQVARALDTPGTGVGRGVLKSVFVSMFLHAGLLHLLSNLWFLWIFGDNVEDRLGHFGFVVFYLACGVAAAAAHVVTHWGSGMPVVGASGAIRGVLGAYLISFPGARVQTLMPFLFMPLLVLIPAGLYLTLWFLGQFMTQAGNVAWQAHVGGFIAGVVLVMLMPDRRGFRVRWRGSPYSSERHHAS